MKALMTKSRREMMVVSKILQRPEPKSHTHTQTHVNPKKESHLKKLWWNSDQTVGNVYRGQPVVH